MLFFFALQAAVKSDTSTRVCDNDDLCFSSHFFFTLSHREKKGRDEYSNHSKLIHTTELVRQ